MGLFTCLGVALAADKAIITNSNDDATHRGPGRYIVMGTKSVTVHGNTYTAPCASSDASLALSSQHGWSTGSAKDWNFGSHDLFWAAITGTNALDNSIADGWLFVNLTGAHQTVAVRRALMDDEATFYNDTSAKSEPKSMTLGSTP